MIKEWLEYDFSVSTYSIYCSEKIIRTNELGILTKSEKIYKSARKPRRKRLIMVKQTLIKFNTEKQLTVIK
jgi:hypothetical protein